MTIAPPPEASAGLPAADLLSIVLAGTQAPSADNQHCFEIRTRRDSILLFGSAAYLSEPFYKKVLSLISFGAVVENMSIRAARLGYRSTLQLQPEPEQASLIAVLQLSIGEPGDAALDAAISTRHTNRRVLFSGPPLSATDHTQFQQLVSGIDGVTLQWFAAGKAHSELLRLIRVAEAERFNTRAMHADLFSAVRFDVGWQASATSGLPPAVLAVEPGARWIFSQLRRWPVMNTLRHLGIHHALGFRVGELPCRLAPQLGVLTTRLSIEPGALAVGRALQRVWLAAEMRGLAFQPLTGAALLALAEYDAVPITTGESLRQGWKHLTDETPLMVFRLGWAKRPEIRTGRQAPESYLA